MNDDETLVVPQNKDEQQSEGREENMLETDLTHSGQEPRTRLPWRAPANKFEPAVKSGWSIARISRGPRKGAWVGQHTFQFQNKMPHFPPVSRELGPFEKGRRLNLEDRVHFVL